MPLALRLLSVAPEQGMLRIFRHYVSGLAFVLLLGDVAVICVALYLTDLSTAWAGYAPFAARLAEATAVTYVPFVNLFLSERFPE